MEACIKTNPYSIACISRLETAQILRFVGHLKILVQERDVSEILYSPSCWIIAVRELRGVYVKRQNKIKNKKIRQKRYIRKDIKRGGTTTSMDWNLYLGPPATQHSFYRALFSLHHFLLLPSQPCIWKPELSLFFRRR